MENKPTILVEENVLKELAKAITCGICHDHFTEPKVLPCCHYFCKQCIQSLALKTGLDQPFSCPECRKTSILPQRSADALPSPLFIHRLKKIHSKLERAYGEVIAKCEMCIEGDKADAFCRTCLQFICPECEAHHRKMKVFLNHKIASLEALKDLEPQELIAPLESVFETCAVHEQPMNIYCFDCKSLICRDCTIKDHNSRTHNYEFVKIAAPEAKKKLNQQLEPLTRTSDSLFRVVEDIRASKYELQKKIDAVKQHINASFGDLIKILEDRRQDLLYEATSRVTEKRDHLSSQEERLFSLCSTVKSVVHYTEQCTKHLTDVEIICIHSDLQSRIGEQVEERSIMEDSGHSVDDVDISVQIDCAEELRRLCKDKTTLSHQGLQLCPTMTVRHAVVNSTAESKLTLKMSDGSLPKQAGDVQCSMKSLEDGSFTKCKIDGKLSDYTIQYTPTVRGRHELTVAVNGRKVSGSPFPVHVSIRPTQLGDPVQVIATEDHPRDVVVRSKGNIMVVALEKSLEVYDNKNGAKLKSINAADCKVVKFLSVTADQATGCVFALGNAASVHQIVKISPELKILKEVGVDGCVNYSGLVVVGHELMMCDSNKGCVVVYNTDLKRVRQFGSKGLDKGKFGETRGLAADHHGNLYVCDVEKCCIQVFNHNGDFLRSFTNKGLAGENKLKCPFGVSVAGQYVYVTDNKEHNVTIFTTEGEFVTSFGSRGEENGCLKKPWGVFVNSVGGFVAVCDFNNSRIQVF